MDEIDIYDETINIENFVKTVTREEYLSNVKTRQILNDEFFYKYDNEISEKIENIFNKLFDEFSCSKFLSTRNAKSHSLAFSSLIYKHIIKEYDLSIFYDCPELARELFKEKMQ